MSVIIIYIFYLVTSNILAQDIWLLIRCPMTLQVVSWNNQTLSYVLKICPRVIPVFSLYVHYVALYVIKGIWTLSQGSRDVPQVQHNCLFTLFLWYPLIYTLTSITNHTSYNTKWVKIYGLPRNTWYIDGAKQIIMVYMIQ